MHTNSLRSNLNVAVFVEHGTNICEFRQQFRDLREIQFAIQLAQGRTQAFDGHSSKRASRLGDKNEFTAPVLLVGFVPDEAALEEFCECVRHRSFAKLKCRGQRLRSFAIAQAYEMVEDRKVRDMESIRQTLVKHCRTKLMDDRHFVEELKNKFLLIVQILIP